jgi:hypothetical protein
LNETLINDFEYQKIYRNYYFNIEEERIREMRAQDADLALKDGGEVKK